MSYNAFVVYKVRVLFNLKVFISFVRPLGFFTNSPQHKNANIANFAFNSAIGKELDQ